MAGVAKLSVVFQSRVGDGVECTPEMILFHASDMKALKVKLGAYVQVEMPTCSILCQTWSSKKAVAGSTTLNKLWQPNFPSDQRKVKVSALGTNW
jgi:hypothetical protein